MNIVFMGTPEFAAVVLRAVAAWERGRIVGVYAQPDRPAGRGKKLKAPAVKEAALELGLPVFQPLHFKCPEDVAQLRALQPDVLVVAAYGLLLPQVVLDVPRLGAYNVHASLLPQYRGAAPIQRAVMQGDAQTGTTIMRMEAGLDTGPILLQQALRIEAEDTAGSLFALLAEQGARMMVGALGMIAEGRAAFIPQNDQKATYAPKIGREEEYIDWTLPAATIHNVIRGLTPVPGARAELRYGQGESLPLKLEPGKVLEAGAGTRDALPGTVTGYTDGALVVACGDGAYALTRLRPAGKGSMSATDLLNGRLRGLTAPYGVLGGPATIGDKG